MKIDTTNSEATPEISNIWLPNELDETGSYAKAEEAADKLRDSVFEKLVKLGLTQDEIAVTFGLEPPALRKEGRKAMSEWRASNREAKKKQGNTKKSKV